MGQEEHLIPGAEDREVRVHAQDQEEVKLLSCEAWLVSIFSLLELGRRLTD